MTIPHIMTVLLVGIMLYSAITDYQKREIPIELFFAVLVPAGIFSLICHAGPAWLEACLTVLMTGGCYLILALFFGGGGGDVIMMAALALCLGYRVGVVIFTATAVLAVYRVWENLCKREVNEIAYAPFVLAGVLLERMLYFFG